MEHGLPAVGRRHVDLCYATRWLSGWSPAVSRIVQHGPIPGLFVAAVAAPEQPVALVKRVLETLDLVVYDRLELRRIADRHLEMSPVMMPSRDSIVNRGDCLKPDLAGRAANVTAPC